jgi:hypothetical protein
MKLIIKMSNCLLGILLSITVCADEINAAIYLSLSKLSQFKESNFKQTIDFFAAAIKILKTGKIQTLDKLPENSNAKMMRDEYGVWFVGEWWRIRVFDKSNSFYMPVNDNCKIIFEEELTDTIKIQVYFKELGNEEKLILKKYLEEEDLLPLTSNAIKVILGIKNLSIGDIEEERDLHKGVFEKANTEGRLFTEEDIGSITNTQLRRKVRKSFKFIKTITFDNKALQDRKYTIIKEENDNPTMYYTEEPFASVLTHSGKRTNTIYLGLNTIEIFLLLLIFNK